MCNHSLISVTVTEIFNTQPCQACGQRPGTVRMVFAAGADRRTALLCEQCAEEVKSPCPQAASPRSTSSAVT